MADDRDTATDAREIYAASLVWDDHCGFSPGPDDALDPLLSLRRDADGIGAVLGGNFRRVAEQVWR